MDTIHFPLGGIGAGMIGFAGNGGIRSVSVRHRPELTRIPAVFAALALESGAARVLEGPMASTVVHDPRFTGSHGEFGGGDPVGHVGLPRFAAATFAARFPFAEVELSDAAIPVEALLTAWTSVIPRDADASSLPTAAIEYRLRNPTNGPVSGQFSVHAENLMTVGQEAASGRIAGIPGGLLMSGGAGADAGSFAIWVDADDAVVDHAWPDYGDLWSTLDRWRRIRERRIGAVPPAHTAAPGGSIAVPVRLAPGEERVIRVSLAWYVPESELVEPHHDLADPTGMALRPPFPGEPTFVPWYAARYASIEAVVADWRDRAEGLRAESARFADSLHDLALPPEIVDAVVANLPILLSPTIMRQADGRIWGWEGTLDLSGGSYGTSTHVWNFAQSIAHLFPELERGLRETEFGEGQYDDGAQLCRLPLPARPMADVPLAESPAGAPAADGQWGGIVKLYRDWRISGDTEWLRRWWPRIVASMEYAIRTWDPDRVGMPIEPHLTTFDLESWGPDSMTATLYLAALSAIVGMGEALDEPVEEYRALLAAGRDRVESELWGGEYFVQRTRWADLRRPFPGLDEAPNVFTLAAEMPAKHPEFADEGPAAQIGDGCNAAGVVGEWLGWAAGLDRIVDPAKTTSHLVAVHRHNHRHSHVETPLPLRTALLAPGEGGLLLCTWPEGSPTFPLHIANESWAGVDYQVAAMLLVLGRAELALDIVRTLRRRHDGTLRNPFAELEAGWWYARSMASYSLLQAYSGARYDAVDRVLHLAPAVPGDFRSFLATATGYGTVGVRDGEPFLELASGDIPYSRFDYTPATT